MRSILSSRWLAAFILVCAVPAIGVGQDADTEEEAATDESAPSAVEEPIELEAQTVTGSRLATGDATARVYSITAEDIKRLGVSNVEDLMRTLPWTYASITQQTSALENSALAPSDVDKNLRAVDNLCDRAHPFRGHNGFRHFHGQLARPGLGQHAGADQRAAYRRTGRG